MSRNRIVGTVSEPAPPPRIRSLVTFVGFCVDEPRSIPLKVKVETPNPAEVEVNGVFCVMCVHPGSVTKPLLDSKSYRLMTINWAWAESARDAIKRTNVVFVRIQSPVSRVLHATLSTDYIQAMDLLFNVLK